MFESGSGVVGAVILAAGSSSRMGRPKQLLRFDGETLLRRAAHAALGAGCDPVVVVTGAHAELMREELRGLDVLEVENQRWETGMGSSVGAGIEKLLEARPAVDAVVLLLCDQPFVTREVVAGLVTARRDTGRDVVASQYGESYGVPALFGRALFDELTRLEGHAGAKQVIKRHAASAHFVTFPGGEIDVDTPEDLSRLLSTQTGQ